MASERVQRQIDRLLDEIEAAIGSSNWAVVQERARSALALDPENEDARSYLEAAERALGREASPSTAPVSDAARQSLAAEPAHPSSFVGGRYRVIRFLGEGGKKRVYQAHDSLLDRDVAFAVIKSDGLDEGGRQRVRREAQAMGRLGDHPHVVSILDIGNDAGQSYLVTQLMGGGDLSSFIAQSPDHRLPVDRTLTIGQQICRALAFASEHGIVHRDLKPGNVWLTNDGTVKLGDFGLAVALDQTRHTQPGLMIGTVAYMAPEQALGGSVDARSDLYALGCVFYELLCGRPPFVGDESVAIITQHLNSPPVAPSWHRPDCPPGLEALILRLLEKDPNKRPASAGEVLASLSAIDAAPPASSLPRDEGAEGNTSAGATSDNPLYRQAFVGREAELSQLQHAYDAAVSGQGSVAMVVGEPGIGKTSLCGQLATYVAVRGGKALVGHCYEEGSLSLPYLPFVEAMRSYVLFRDPDGLTSDLGSGAGEVARIVSEIRDRLPVPERPPGDPEEERWRLLQAVTGFLRNASQVQPLLVVLEDLHDCDRGTLDLLLHLSHNLAGARLLIIGTYRDVEVDRAHPLSSALAELRRGGSFLRVPLRGLTADEVQRMMASVAQREIPWPLSELVHRQTEGNPLFVQEMLRYLVEEGLVEHRDGALRRVGDETLADRIPEGLRDVIGKRLSRLSAQTNQVLAVAAVIGREFRLDVLQRVANLPEEELFPALKEATAVAVVEERAAPGTAVGYRFTHAFFRQTLYEETIAPLRIRLHQRVARALEDVYGRRVNEHAAELAEHYSYSSDPVDLTKAVDYGERAGERAGGVYAYGEAVRHLEQALKVQQVLDPEDGAHQCDLLLRLGEMLSPTGQPLRGAEEAEKAFAMAERLGDRERAARACRIALEVLYSYAGGAAPGIPGWQQWVERGDQYAVEGTADRVYINAWLARVHLAANRWSQYRALEDKALELARSLKDPGPLLTLIGMPLGAAAFRRPAAHQWESDWGLAQEFVAKAGEGVHAAKLARGWLFAGIAYLNAGDRAQAEELWEKAAEIGERTSDDGLLTRRLVTPILAMLDGRLEGVVEAGAMLIAEAQALGRSVMSERYAAYALLRPLLHLGRADEALTRWTQGVAGTGLRADAARALCLAHLGRTAEARDLVVRHAPSPDVPSEEDQTPAGELSLLLEAAVLVGDREHAASLAQRLVPIAHLTYVDYRNATSMARHLGAAAALCGDPERARQYLEQALEVCARVRFRPEIALTQLQLAELLLDHFPDGRTEAITHLDAAIGELRDMNMQPALERALRRKLQLQGVAASPPSMSIDAVALAVATERPDLRPHAAPDGTVTLLFTDIEDSTSLTVKLGDQRWLEILRAHHTLVRQQVQAHGGFEVKNQGDGFMLAFGSARRALECAVAIQRAVGTGNASYPDAPIRVRMGLHTGEALKDANDFHGRHVVLAARIADQARGGEILVSALLKELTQSSGDLRFDEGREVELKGLPGAHRVFGLLRI